MNPFGQTKIRFYRYDFKFVCKLIVYLNTIVNVPEDETAFLYSVDVRRRCRAGYGFGVQRIVRPGS